MGASDHLLSGMPVQGIYVQQEQALQRLARYESAVLEESDHNFDMRIATLYPDAALVTRPHSKRSCPLTPDRVQSTARFAGEEAHRAAYVQEG